MRHKPAYKNPPKAPSTRRKIPVNMKLRFVEMMEGGMTAWAIEKQFSWVNGAQLRRWFKQKESLRELAEKGKGSKLTLHGGRPRKQKAVEGTVDARPVLAERSA